MDTDGGHGYRYGFQDMNTDMDTDLDSGYDPEVRIYIYVTE